MFAAIVSWLILAVLLCVLASRMWCALYVVCSAGLYITYTLLATAATPIVGGGKQQAKPYMAALLDALTRRIQTCMNQWLGDSIVALGTLPKAKVDKILQKHTGAAPPKHVPGAKNAAVFTYTLGPSPGKYLQHIAFDTAGIRQALPQIAQQLAGCVAPATPTISSWIAAYINSELPVVRQIKDKRKHARYEIFGPLPGLLENLTIDSSAEAHPIFGYGLRDASPPASLIDNHIWDTYLNVKWPKHILSVHDRPRESLFAHNADAGVFPVRHYSYVSRRVHTTTIDVYTRNLLPAPGVPGDIDAPADGQIADEVATLYAHAPLHVVPDGQRIWPRVGIRAAIVHRHYRQIFTQQLRAHTWTDYFEYVLRAYLPRRAKPGQPVGVADYIVDMAIGGMHEMDAICTYIDKILADIYAPAPVYAVEYIAAQIQAIDCWLKSCGDDLDAIVAHDANNVYAPDQARIIGYSNTPGNFYRAVLPEIAGRAAAIVSRYNSIPQAILRVVAAEYPRLLGRESAGSESAGSESAGTESADTSGLGAEPAGTSGLGTEHRRRTPTEPLRAAVSTTFVEYMLRRHTGVKCVFTPYTLEGTTNVIRTRETYSWVLGDTRYDCLYRELPPLQKIVCTYVARRYAYAGNMDEIYLRVAELVPAAICDTPSASVWRAVLRYCQQFAARGDVVDEDYVDNTDDLHRDDVLRQLRTDAASRAVADAAAAAAQAQVAPAPESGLADDSASESNASDDTSLLGEFDEFDEFAEFAADRLGDEFAAKHRWAHPAWPAASVPRHHAD